jgi:hypothetical protein
VLLAIAEDAEGPVLALLAATEPVAAGSPSPKSPRTATQPKAARIEPESADAMRARMAPPRPGEGARRWLALRGRVVRGFV